MRLREPFPAIVAIIRLCAAAAPMQLTWTTDLGAFGDSGGFGGSGGFGARVFGPDGPWQAVAVYVGALNISSSHGIPVPLWPSGSDISEIPTIEAGGNYSTNASSSAVGTGVFMGTPDKWSSSVFLNSSNSGSGFFDSISLSVKASDDPPTRTNATIFAAEEYSRVLPDGRRINESVGILGLGPKAELGPEALIEPPSILEQLKSARRIDTMSFSVHMGSAVFGQPGSLVLGGYEQNRALGRTGVFAFFLSLPAITLLDVALGVETGGSPFNDPNLPISVYRGLGGNEQAAAFTREAGGKLDSAVVILNPASPYIYLPPGTCEAAAERLPVSFDPDLGLYLWDTSNPRFTRIVTSPAYLAFTISDRTAANVTIKVPFALLNLTLTAPIVDKPTAYFPCKSFNSELGMWQFGRAFLQAAFFAVNYDTNLTFLAQAPGPDMEQSVTKAMGEGDRAVEGLSEDRFEKSWRPFWTALPEEAPGPREGGLSTGAIAGIAVSATALGGIGAIAAVLLLRRRSRRVHKASADKCSKNMQSEVQGTPVQEMAIPDTTQELPGTLLAFELPANSIK